jgi:hemolysin activation/secretion protein
LRPPWQNQKQLKKFSYLLFIFSHVWMLLKVFSTMKFPLLSIFHRFPLALLLCSGAVLAVDDAFDLQRIDVTGNTLLGAEEIKQLTSPFIGKDKGFRDIQMALEALETAYRKAGYTAVQVITPEQELTGGTLHLEVQETPIASVTVSGNKFFSEANIRATMPSLIEGKTPNARLLSENVQLANENPAKQIDVVLAVSEKSPGKLDATINVEDEATFRGFITADNTGSDTTGGHRLGISLRHSNLWDRDHTATFSYTGSPDKPDGTKVDIYSLGYRVPFYSIGDSIDLFYAKSNINTPAAAFTLGAFENLTGKGDLYGVRWNHYFQRHGEWSTKLVGGLDVKVMDTTCTGPAGEKDYLKGLSAGCTPYITRPLSATYSGNWQRPGMAADFSAGIAYNLATGRDNEYNTVDGKTGNDNYSLVSSSRETRNNFSVLKLGGSYSHTLPDGWMARVAGSLQSSLGTPLPPSEQIGLSGSQAVRGFHERIVASDAGYIANVELYAPNVAPILTLPGELHPLFFVDTARGHSYKMPGRSGTTTVTEPSGIMSAGRGVRYSYKKDVQVRLDVANVLNAGPAADIADSSAAYNGQWRGQFNVLVGF